MVSVIARMKVLRAKLYNLRNGLGAATFPKEVKRLALRFNYSNANGHMGPRKFWHLYLPRIQYANPDVRIDVLRESATEGPATLTVYYDKEIPERELDIKGKLPEDIATELLALTQAANIPRKFNEPDLSSKYQELEKDKKVEQREALKIRQRRKKNLKAKRPTVVEDVL